MSDILIPSSVDLKSHNAWLTNGLDYVDDATPANRRLYLSDAAVQRKQSYRFAGTQLELKNTLAEDSAAEGAAKKFVVMKSDGTLLCWMDSTGHALFQTVEFLSGTVTSTAAVTSELVVADDLDVNGDCALGDAIGDSHTVKGVLAGHHSWTLNAAASNTVSPVFIVKGWRGGAGGAQFSALTIDSSKADTAATAAAAPIQLDSNVFVTASKDIADAAGVQYDGAVDTTKGLFAHAQNTKSHVTTGAGGTQKRYTSGQVLAKNTVSVGAGSAVVGETIVTVALPVSEPDAIPDITALSDIVIKVEQAVAQPTGTPASDVASVAALRAVVAVDRANSQLRYVTATGLLYRFVTGDASTDDSITAIAPTDGDAPAGRWLLVPDRIAEVGAYGIDLRTGKTSFAAPNLTLVIRHTGSANDSDTDPAKFQYTVLRA